jgi:sugar/nucleoside kinase (ribokinase family)
VNKILVSGLINVETTLAVEKFPIEYSPVRYPFFGVNSTISGVGFNIAKALRILGDQVSLLSMIGRDIQSRQVYQALSDAGIDSRYVLDRNAATPQSVILFEPNGNRQINVDLKDIQQQHYPMDKFDDAISEAEIAVLCNTNFSRNLLMRAKSAGIPVATDVHTISKLDDDFNSDFMAAADILFCSDETLPCAPEDWAEKILNSFGVSILVIGLGAKGAFLAVRDRNIREKLPPFHTRRVVNTIGAGDALFSCFLQYFVKTKEPTLSLRKAMTYASYKIGCGGAAEGFLNEEELENICVEYSAT